MSTRLSRKDVTVETDIEVSTRDGTKLATDIYRPADQARHPVLVIRTPYSKSAPQNANVITPLSAAQRGYVVVMQDIRGRFKSDGVYEPFVNEQADGYDAVEWAASQSWSDGGVGVYGSSAAGTTALAAVVARPPHLKSCILYSTVANFHEGWVYSGGAFELGFNYQWIIPGLVLPDKAHLASEGISGEELRQMLIKAFANSNATIRHVPPKELQILGTPVTRYWRKWLSHPSYDEYWKQIDVSAKAQQIKIPMMHISGWYDTFLRGHLDLNKHLRTDGGSPHRLVLGPWEHHTYVSSITAAGDRDFGSEASMSPAILNEIALEWFDGTLRGLPTKGFERVRYFLMGENKWVECESWPPAHKQVRYYLRSAGHANSRFGDGLLTVEGPNDSESYDAYVYDPENPVITNGGRLNQYKFGPGGVQNQATIEEREDVLVYTSMLLPSPVIITGPVSAALSFSSNAPDTDVAVKLVDVEPNGYCANIAEGMLRARYRDGPEREELLEPGRIHKLTVSLLDVAHSFLVGHRIRLEVTSSNFPKHDRNLNSSTNPVDATAKEIRKAVNKVFHDNTNSSFLSLPIRD